MSVLIKGLTIPTIGVRHCVISFSNGRLLISDVCGNSIFEGNYVEIPTPHGRLIDADELTRCIEHAYGDRDIVRLVTNNIARQPTIIEAEELNENS
jgi:hypothetical protein